MNRQPRKFDVIPAVRERTPLIITIAGPSGTGKTFSALRLATGIQRVFGGKIGLVDTEARRGLHYADKFKIEAYVDFAPPFGPLDYKDAIDTAIAKGATILIVDSMTHEHSGEGGVMDQIEKFLDEKCGNDFGKRHAMNMIGHARVKPQRKVLNNHVVQLGRANVVLILLYRAREIVKPMTKSEKEAARRSGEEAGLKDLGMQPETTSPLIYETTIGFLLKPGADGRPTILSRAETDEEKTIAKTPDQFRSWDLGKQLDEDLGEKLARWSMGEKVGGAAPAQGGAAGSPQAARGAASPSNVRGGSEQPGKTQADKVRAQWLEFWGKKGITEAQVLAAVGDADIAQRSNFWVAEIKAKRLTIEELFPAPPPAAASEPANAPPPDPEKGDEPTEDEWLKRETT